MKNCIKLSLLVLVFLILVDLIVLCDGQTTVFNETGTKAYGLKVQFNKPVTITRAGKNFDSYLSMDKNTILFSDGVVEPWADFFFFWKPKEAEILSYKWLSKSELPVNRSSKEGSSELILGGQIQYYLAHKNWDDHWKEVNPLKVLHENGMDWIQVRLTTTSIDELRNTGPEEWDDLPDEDWWEYFHGGSLEYVEQILKEASSIGMKLNLGFYLSHEGAHSSVQKTPPKWKGLELNELISTVHDYCFQTTEYFKERGLNIEIYNVGNEIQEGILGYLPGQKIPIPDHVDDPLANISYMRSKVWKVEARLLKAAIRGIKESDNDAKITIHVSGSSGKELINPFFQTMVSEGVEFDYAGITFPGVERDWPVRFKDDPFGWIKPIIDHLQTLNKKVIFSEFTYPNDPSGIGGVPLPVPDLPKWKTHVSAPGYPLTPSGQAKWVRDFLSFCRREENVAGAFYYYPEFFPGICEEQVKCYPPDEGFGLFSSDQKARLALSQFKENPERFPDVILLDEKDNSVKWSGSWESDWDDSHVGKTRKGSGHEGSKVTVNFSGTGITLIH
ncbi:glycosyl hydrolase 53 family protein, partial [Candidatus Bipolaricaulota bacterium]|nr:glycosyl hydrolase 53 family protein [Candidatus Bipolaricaulota bacterium]